MTTDLGHDLLTLLCVVALVWLFIVLPARRKRP